MPKKVIVPQPRMQEYDKDQLNRYIAYNKRQILEFLHSQATTDPLHLFKPHDLEVAAILKSVFDSWDKQITEVAHYMVILKKYEYCIARGAQSGSDIVHLRFAASFIRLEVFRLIYKVVEFSNSIRKEHELKHFKVPVAMELLIVALEGLPAQNFYMTFSGIKETKTPN